MVTRAETCELINLDGNVVDCYVEFAELYLAKGFKKVGSKEVSPIVKPTVKPEVKVSR